MADKGKFVIATMTRDELAAFIEETMSAQIQVITAVCKLLNQVHKNTDECVLALAREVTELKLKGGNNAKTLQQKTKGR
jgi:2-hydroxy-3-keto-5-methylthiopentenyl-1-phosphate phosphatase